MEIYSDSHSAIELANTKATNSRNKQIKITFPFVQEFVQQKQVELDYRTTNDMVADPFTKPLGRVTL